jgi:hypothetical protein
LCSRDSETVLHLLVNCNFTQQVWQRIKCGLNIKYAWEGNNLNACFDSWVKKERNFITLPSMVCWFVWLERNKKIFEHGNPTIHSVVIKSLGKVDRHISSQKVYIPRNIQLPSQALPTVGWFDGATQTNGLQSGAGGVIKLFDKNVYK